MNQVEKHLLSGFAKINDFDLNNWESLSLEQRVQLLQEAADYIAQTQNWRRCKVIAHTFDDMGDSPHCGAFNNVTYTIMISTKRRLNIDYYVETMETFFHEVTHWGDHERLNNMKLCTSKEEMISFALLGNKYAFKREKDEYEYSEPEVRAREEAIKNCRGLFNEVNKSNLTEIYYLAWDSVKDYHSREITEAIKKKIEITNAKLDERFIEKFNCLARKVELNTTIYYNLPKREYEEAQRELFPELFQRLDQLKLSLKSSQKSQTIDLNDDQINTIKSVFEEKILNNPNNSNGNITKIIDEMKATKALNSFQAGLLRKEIKGFKISNQDDLRSVNKVLNIIGHYSKVEIPLIKEEIKQLEEKIDQKSNEDQFKKNLAERYKKRLESDQFWNKLERQQSEIDKAQNNLEQFAKHLKPLLKEPGLFKSFKDKLLEERIKITIYERNSEILDESLVSLISQISCDKNRNIVCNKLTAFDENFREFVKKLDLFDQNAKKYLTLGKNKDYMGQTTERLPNENKQQGICR